MYPHLHAHFFRFFSQLLCSVGVLAVLSFKSFPIHAQEPTPVNLASKTISLENRYPVKTVSDVFKDNILLTLAYMKNEQTKDKAVNWKVIEKPSAYEFSLTPGQVFAFHDSVKGEYAPTLAKTTNAHFNSTEGFKSDDYLIGDGVCHLASLFYWAAKDAGLQAEAPVSHDFAAIPQIDKKYGVAIYADPTNMTIGQEQNLYIRNNQAAPITFRINYNGKDLTVEIVKQA